MSALYKSTIVRTKNHLMRGYFRYAERVAPRRAGHRALQLWFAAPARMDRLPVPAGGEAFEVRSQGATIRGRVWTPEGVDASESGTHPAGGPIYLMHGWGGRGSQFGAFVEPLVRAGHRVVLFDAPAHGDSDPGPAGPRRTNGLEFARALDDVFARFGPAEAVVAHSLGTIATYLALRFGWLGTHRLVLIAPMVESTSLLDQFQAALGFGPRTRRAFDRAVHEWIGIPVADFDARVQAASCGPLPTLVVADRDDRQTPYADAADLAGTVGAAFMTTEGLGHRRILRDPTVISRVVDFVADPRPLAATA